MLEYLKMFCSIISKGEDENCEKSYCVGRLGWWLGYSY